MILKQKLMEQFNFHETSKQALLTATYRERRGSMPNKGLKVLSSKSNSGTELLLNASVVARSRAEFKGTVC